jgi:hypothetical protein
LKSPSFFDRYATPILIVCAFAVPTLFYGAHRAVRSNTNKVEDWLPSGFPETADLAWFRDHFGGHMFVIASWDGCRLGGDPDDPDAEPDDPRIERLARTLVPAEESADGGAEGEVGGDRSVPEEEGIPLPEGVRRYFRSVVTCRRLLNQMTSPPMSLPYDEALDRLKGILLGPDGRQTCVVISLSDAALGNFRAVLARGLSPLIGVQRAEGVLFDVLRACDIDMETLHLGGPPVDNVAIDEEGERSLARLALLAGVVSLGLAWWSLRSIKLTLIVFGCGLISAAAALAAIWLTRETTDAIMMSMPPLIYVLSISGAVHLINYYHDAVEQYGLAGAPERAIAHGWKPAVLCTVTTALGLLSLLTSDIVPIRKFGVYSALGVTIMLLALFVCLPAALQLWPPRRYRRLPVTQPSSGTEATPGAAASAASGRPGTNDDLDFEHRWSTVFWSRFGDWIMRHYVFVTVSCAILIATVGYGVTRIHTTIDLLKLFDRRALILADYRWLEQHVSRLVPLEIVLRFDNEALKREGDSAADQSRLTLLQRMELVAEVHRTVAERFGAAGEDVIAPPMSALVFAPKLPAARKGLSAVTRRSATNSMLGQSYDLLAQGGFVRSVPEEKAELWRISLRVAAFKDVDYGRFTDDLRHVVDPVIARINAQHWDRATPRISAIYTGVVPIVYKAQRALLDSLIQSAFWSFVTITPVVMIVSRGVIAGCVAMLPNVLPVLVVFGGMGWLGVAVDIGAMMSASIALGVAVDDTIHYLTWFRDELNRTGDRRRAILVAYRRCATPTLQAAFINGLGLSVFACSAFAPTKQFGFLMLTILFAGVVAELILLPALLVGPLGRAFGPSRQGRPRYLVSVATAAGAGEPARPQFNQRPHVQRSSRVTHLGSSSSANLQDPGS